MDTITVSPKFQIVIPKNIRENMHIKAGNKLQMFPFEARIEIVPVKSIKKLKGIVAGINTTINRDKDRF